MADSAFDTLARAAADTLALLDSYGPDEDQDDDVFVATRAALRTALDAAYNARDAEA